MHPFALIPSRSLARRRLVALMAFALLPLASSTGTLANDPPEDESTPAETPDEEQAPTVAPPSGDAPAPGLDATAIVVTFDSGFVDAGFAGDKAPRVSERFYLHGGRVSDWAGFEALLRHIFKRLGASADAHPVILSEPMGVPAAEREKLTQLMFETFNVPAFYLAVDGVLACYASGRTTCLVVTSPDDTQTVAVYDGYTLPHAHLRVPVGRLDIAAYAMKLMGDAAGHVFPGGDRRAFEQLVEQHGYFAYDFDAERSKAQTSSELEVNVELPNGQTRPMGAERFTAPEAIFKPSLIGFEAEGMHVAVYHSIMKCDVDVRKDLYANVVVAGRTLSLPGLAERLTKEVVALAPQSMSINVTLPPEAAQSVWNGASILASLSTFKQMWVSRQEYDTSGPSIIGRKAF